jgi:PAS domain S-box-containing protein
LACGAWIIQTLNQNRIVVEVPDLAASNKKSVIRVLHVDDDSSILEISKLIMMDMDASLEFDNAICVDEAFKKLSTGQYDVVISDYEMPQKNGLQFLKELREGKNEIPFILFTGKGREEVVIQALNLGADHYVNKQGSPETVYSELAHLVSSAVEKSRAKLRNENDSLALHNVRDAIVSSDANFIITSWNKAAEELFGFGSDEVLQKNVDDVFEKIEVEPTYDELMRQLKTTGQFQGEVVYQNKNRQKRNGDLHIASIVSENGKYLGNVAVCSDITERKRTEKALIESEANYKNLINGMNDSAWVIDLDGNFVYVNVAAAKSLGYSKEELLSMGVKGIDKHLSPEQIKNLVSAMAVVKNRVFETVHTKKDGKEIPVEISSSLITFQGKQAVLSIARNISERKNAQDALRQERDMLESVTAASGAGLVIVSKDYRVQWANEFIKRYKGDTIGKLCYATLNSLDSPCHDCGVAKIFAGKTLLDSHEYFSTTVDGNPYWVEIVATPITDENGNVISAVEIAVDITERKKAEDKLRESQYLTQKILDCSPNLIYIYDLLDKRNVYTNRELPNFLGYTPEQVKSMGSELFANILHPDDAEVVAKHHALFVNAPNNATFDVEYRMKNSSGEWQWLRSRDTLFARTKEGLGKQILGICEDITEGKKAEEEVNQMMDQLVLVNEKLGVVGGLTRHDARNKLSVINGSTYLLKKKHSDQADVVETLNRIEQAIKEIVKIFDFAKIYEQIGAEELTYIKVGEKLNEARALFSGPIPTITNECHGLTVLADPFLRQLFFNFIDNTRKYGEKTITIRVYFEKADEDCLKLVYEDDGVGVPFENKQRLFNEGFSTGGSTGFGLFLTKKMIDVYGWTITEEGEPGKGAKFTITIPKLNKNGKENYQIVPQANSVINLPNPTNG